MFVDVTDAVGIDHEHVRPAWFDVVEQTRQQSLLTPFPIETLAVLPTRPNGLPGTALLDHDGDGDLDLYVATGAGGANRLFSNQLAETGALAFVDVAPAAGVTATDQESSGVCHGDLDNDGDTDLLVLGLNEPNRLFENLGDGTFAEVAGSGLEGGSRASSSCSMGDVDGDGLLDVFVGNAFDVRTSLACFVVPFALNQHNQLFVSQGGLTFADVSAASGIEDHVGFRPPAPGAAGITWAVAAVDVDLDGDVDLVAADDNCAMPFFKDGGVDRGFVHTFLNDGSGHFTDVPGPIPGDYMGLTFGDLDCDGRMDLFASNFGDYNLPTMGMPYTYGDLSTRWFLGNGDGSFAVGDLGGLVASPFGWGTAAFDHDNDGDQDLLYQGSLDALFMLFADNAGVLLENEGCSARFTDGSSAFASSHVRRNDQGVAVGDLDRDGFVDVVTTSNANVPPGVPLLPSPAAYGSPFDATALWVPTFVPSGGGLSWSGIEFAPGDVRVELNSGNANGWVAVTVRGSVGLVAGARSNRDGFGAVVSFDPDGETPAVLSPVVGGSSSMSQHAAERIFGLGDERRGTVEVLWPGGVRNRLHGVRSGERIVFPEIPCSFDDESLGFPEYRRCVGDALDALVAGAHLAAGDRGRFLASALRAFHEER